ncbi:MAG: monovalent cation/H+ antiporter complex subunit F [Verrucomicrobiota bacterium]
MTFENLIPLSINIGYIFLSVALIASLYRLVKGPANVDRIIALDLIAGLAIAISVLLSIQTGQSVYLNVSLCLAIIAFLSTVAFAKRLERRPQEIWK